jgi:transcriptional regulator with XRE-family HTH domain
MDIRKLVGANIARLRKERGYTQEQFCDISGLAQSYLSKLENGRINLTLLGINDVVQALNVQPEALFERSSVEAKSSK